MPELIIDPYGEWLKKDIEDFERHMELSSKLYQEDIQEHRRNWPAT